MSSRSSRGDGIDSEEAVALAFVSEFKPYKMNQINLETTAIERTIRNRNGHSKNQQSYQSVMLTNLAPFPKVKGSFFLDLKSCSATVVDFLNHTYST
jgi:hypothetical protein